MSAWRVSLEARGLGSSSIIVRLSAIRKLAVEAGDNGLLAPELAAGIARLKGVKIKAAHKTCKRAIIYPMNTSPATPRSSKLWILWTILFVFVLPLLGFSAWVWSALHVSYSTGERTGYVQKISKKGWVCKTWEGELAMVNLPGTTPQLFSFSVRDDAVARQLLDAAGQRVALMYDQHRGVPTHCFGETEYFITRVRPLGR
ncbi:MAG: hypothetical protein ACR2I2_21360 [Bryobacteraceae bacterium]